MRASDLRLCPLTAGQSASRFRATRGSRAHNVGHLRLLTARTPLLPRCGSPSSKSSARSASWLPETTCYPRPVSRIPVIVGGGGEKRTLAIAARLGDGCNLPSDISTLDRKLAIFRQHCMQAGRDPAQAEVTMLDIPVIGRDREDAASIVEKLRGRTTAAAFAQRHHAGTTDDHIGR